MGLSLKMAVALLPIIVGCAPSDAPRSAGGDHVAAAPAGDVGTEPQLPEGGAKGSVTLRTIDEAELAAAIAGHRGKVVLVDFWATWCLTCTELFPHTVSLHERYADKGLAVISVSFDDLESRPAVLGFLEKHRAAFENFMSRYGAGVESAERFDLPGGLPRILLFDRQGELAGEFPEPHSPVNPAAIDRAVEALLVGESSQEPPP